MKLHRALPLLFLLPLPAQPPEGALKSGIRLGSGPVLELSTAGPEGLWPGDLSHISWITANQGVILYRVFVNRQQEPLFAYKLRVEEVPGKRSYRITVEPAEPAILDQFAGEPWLQHWDRSRPLPTFRRRFAPREMKPGDRLSIALLRDPASGRQVSDILRVSEPAGPWRSRRPAAGSLRLSNLQVIVDQEKVAGPLAGGAEGKYVMLDWPGHGRFFFSLAVPARPEFQKTGQVRGQELRFTWGGKRYRLVGDQPVAAVDGPLDLWVYVEPAGGRFSSAAAAGSHSYRAADRLEFLLPVQP